MINNAGYTNIKETEADADLMYEVWMECFGEQAMTGDFKPQMFEIAPEGTRASAWIGIFRDRMLEKYKNFEIVEAKVKVILLMLGIACLEQNLPSDESEPDTNLDFLFSGGR